MQIRKEFTDGINALVGIHYLYLYKDISAPSFAQKAANNDRSFKVCYLNALK